MIGIKKIQIPGLPTKEPRRLYFYLPQDYDNSGYRYPVLYMFDGHNVFYDSHATYGKSWGMNEFLTRTRLPIILVAVSCNPEGEKRMNEYAPWNLDIPDLGHLDGLGKLTMDWIVGALKPSVDKKFRTLPDRENTMIAGSSMGGLMSLFAVTAYNDVFSRAAALSPCIWAGGENLRALITGKRLKETTRIYMDHGTGEVHPDDPDCLKELFITAADLAGAGAQVAARVVPRAKHNEAAWEKRIPIFMNYLLNEKQD